MGEFFAGLRDAATAPSRGLSSYLSWLRSSPPSPEKADYIQRPVDEAYQRGIESMGQSGPPVGVRDWLDAVAHMFATGLAVRGSVKTDQVLDALKTHRDYSWSHALDPMRRLIKQLEDRREFFDRAWRKVGGKGPTEVSALREGGEAWPFAVRRPGDDVPREVLKLYPHTQRALEIAARKPEVLIPTLEMNRQPAGRLSYMVQPYATPVPSDEFFRLILPAIKERAAREGYKFFDASRANVGLYKNFPYVIDAGALMLSGQ